MIGQKWRGGPKDRDTLNDDARVSPINPGEPLPNSSALLDAQAKVAAQVETVNRMQDLSRVDQSIVAGLQAAVTALRWLGVLSMYDKQVGRDVHLLAELPAHTVASYLALTNHADALVQEVASSMEESTDWAGGVISLLEDVASFLRELTETVSSIDLGAVLRDRYVETATTLNQLRLWRRTEGAVQKIEESADSKAEVAGEESQLALSTEFDGLATQEVRAALIFRVLTILLFVGVIVYAAAVAYSEKEPSVEMAQKLAVGVPVLLLAGYFAKEGAQHRKTARWAGVLGVQLRSVRAYTVGLDPDETKALRAEFGRRVFMETPDTTDALAGMDATQTTSPLNAGLVREITELVRTAQQKPGG